MTETTSPAMLTVADLMRGLQLSRSKVYEMLAAGEIPSVKIGRSRRVPRESYEAWVNNLTESVSV